MVWRDSKLERLIFKLTYYRYSHKPTQIHAHALRNMQAHTPIHVTVEDLRERVIRAAEAEPSSTAYVDHKEGTQ